MEENDNPDIILISSDDEDVDNTDLTLRLPTSEEVRSHSVVPEESQAHATASDDIQTSSTAPQNVQARPTVPTEDARKALEQSGNFSKRKIELILAAHAATATDVQVLPTAPKEVQARPTVAPSGVQAAPPTVSIDNARNELEQSGNFKEHKIKVILDGLLQSMRFTVPGAYPLPNSSSQLNAALPTQPVINNIGNNSIPFDPKPLTKSLRHTYVFTSPAPQPQSTPAAPRKSYRFGSPPPPRRIRGPNVVLSHHVKHLIAGLEARAPKEIKNPKTIENSNNSPLLKLPGELRNRIYRYALVKPTETIEISAANWNTHQPGLLKTCTQVRGEALPLFYAENKLSTNIHNWDPVVKDRCYGLCARHGIRSSSLHHYFTGDPNWANLLAWLQAVFEGRIGGISDCVGKNRNLERKTIGIMFMMVRNARTNPVGSDPTKWGLLWEVLEAQRGLLGMGDARWLL